MDLCSVTVAGFRRFRTRSSLKTNGKLVALLGPNEAGKSSLLYAISLLGHDNPPESRDFTRGDGPDAFSIEGRYFLSADDLKVAGLTRPSWLKVTKLADGARTFVIEPSPKRDLTLRRKLKEGLKAARANAKFISRVESEDLLGDSDAFDKIMDLLANDAEDLGAPAVQKIIEFVDTLAAHILDNDTAIIKALPNIAQKFREVEKLQNPNTRATNALKSRLPDILFFDADARALASDYDLATLSAKVPEALENLCQIAGLNIGELLEAKSQGDTAQLTTLEHRANDRLRKRFRTDWQQSGVSVAFRLQDTRLAVQVVNERHEFTSFAERSDGLRQFVALQAFATGKRKGSQILLVDEADQKLHYDAQADLVQMLARQQIASKVIYTTHSAGCLPEDLGNGVRFARPRCDDETRSEIANKFWAENEPGFAPLLFGMGASTLAFFPTRHAVMVEGPSDMLLLPTMFREALALEVLGFQFVPGLSYFDEEGLAHAPAIGKDNGILYLVDGDSGGNDLKNRLLKRQLNKEDIFVLRSGDGKAKEVEDFLDAGLLLEAVNQILSKYYQNVAQFTMNDLVAIDRMVALEKTFLQRTKCKLPKVELAYEVLDILAENPSRRILAPNRQRSFKQIAASMLKRMEARAKREGSPK